MFPIKELPFELRALIYPHALILQHDNSAPALLLAAAADARLYAEVRRIYRGINAILTIENQDAFGKLKIRQLTRIRHLKCVFPGPMASQAPVPSLHIYKPLLLNNLLSITLDFSAPSSHSSMHSNILPRAPYSNPLDLVKQFLKASVCGLSQITIKLEPWAAAYVPYTDYGLETDVSYYNQETSLLNKDIESLNAHLGIMGKLERVVSADVVLVWGSLLANDITTGMNRLRKLKVQVKKNKTDQTTSLQGGFEEKLNQPTYDEQKLDSNKRMQTFVSRGDAKIKAEVLPNPKFP